MASFSKLGLLKGVAELAVSAGVGVVVGNLVKATTPDEISKFQRVMVAIGGYGLTGVLSDISAKHIAGQIDNYAEKVDNLFHPVVEQAKEEIDNSEVIDTLKAQLKKSVDEGDPDGPKLSDDHK